MFVFLVNGGGLDTYLIIGSIYLSWHCSSCTRAHNFAVAVLASREGQLPSTLPALDGWLHWHGGHPLRTVVETAAMVAYLGGKATCKGRRRVEFHGGGGCALFLLARALVCARFLCGKTTKKNLVGRLKSRPTSRVNSIPFALR